MFQDGMPIMKAVSWKVRTAGILRVNPPVDIGEPILEYRISTAADIAE
jgi:hypothetical protein